MHDLVVWLVAAVGSIATTHYLVAITKPRHPFHILLLHAVAALVLRALRYAGLVQATRRTTTSNGPRKVWVPINPLRLLRVITTVAALICAYKCFELVKNVATLAMILSLDWSPRYTVSKDNESRRQKPSITSNVLRSIIFTCGIVVIVLKDYRLHASADTKYLLGTACLTAVAKCLNRRPEEEAADGPVHCIDENTTTLLLATSISVLGFTSSESAGPSFFSMSPMTFFLNVLTSAVALEGGCYPFKCLLAPSEGSQGISTILCDRPLGRATISGILAVAVVVVNNTFGHPCVISAWQCAGYVVAAAAFIGRADLAELTCAVRPTWASMSSFDVETKDVTEVDLFGGSEPAHTAQQSPGSPKSEWISFTSIPSRAAFAPLLPLAAGIVIWVSVSLVKLTSLTANGPISPESTSSNQTLDIVINRYQETAEVVAASMNTLISLPSIERSHPRIFIYNKNEVSDDQVWTGNLAALLPPELNVSMHSRPNIGREAEAYLHHILTNYEDLADHMLFMQAELTEPANTRHRLDQYFVPSTGFLSLSWVGNICVDCTVCQDSYSWIEDGKVLSSIYSAANPGAECKDLVLTYQGQFVVSASRIQSNSKQMYEDIRRQLIDYASDKHKSPYLNQSSIQAQNDSLNAPVFGYTVERMWGAMMKCSEARIAYECPSLLAGVMGNVGRLESCQCLD